MHTPGPWEYVPWHIAEGNSQVRAPEGWLICEASSDSNARLIAAAPDLLEVLKDYRRRCLCKYENSVPTKVDACFTCQQAERAIAKAEGK